MSEIQSHQSEFLDWIKATFPDKSDMISKYRPDRYLIYYFYIPMADIALTDDEKLCMVI